MTVEAFPIGNIDGNTESIGSRGINLSVRKVKERRKRMRPRFWIGVVFITILGLMAVFAPVIAPHEPTAFNPLNRLEGPSATFIMGTDLFGRDLFSRILYGARITISIALGAGTLAAVLGISLGALSGLIGGWFDQILTQIMDAWLALPYVLVAVVLVITFGRGDVVLMLALGISGVAGIYRLVRVETQRTRSREYLEVAIALGATRFHLIRRHILPDVLPTMTVIIALQLGRLLIAVSSLSFLGLGPPPPSPEWGALLNDGRNYLQDGWWLTVFPGLAVGLTVFAINLIGDGLRDWFDPRNV